VSALQPVRHAWPSGSQTGAAVPQSAFDRHATHLKDDSRHRGCEAGHSALLVHCTHVLKVGLQIACGWEQSVFALHPTHAPVAVSQRRTSLLPAHDASVVHAAWHL
jgi:hypothetical protein